MTEERTMGAIATAVAAGVALVLSAGALITAASVSTSAPPEPGSASPTIDAPDRVDVDVAEFALTPSSITIAEGGTLVVHNAGSIEHDLAIVDQGITTPMLGAGETHELSLAGLAPGTYGLLCTVPGHESAGMVGTLTVIGPDGVQPTADAGPSSQTEEVDWAGLDQAMHDSIMAFPAETEGRGNQLLEPEEVLADGTKVFRLVAEIIDWEVEPGRIVEGWAYNGQIPGPMIRVDVGDNVRVHVENDLPMGTDVHWHGVRVPNDQDGVAPLTQPLIESGGEFTYEFVADEPSIGMYHPHNHGQKKVPNGMFGVFIIGEVGDEFPLPTGRTIGGRVLPDEIDVVAEIPMVLNDAGTIGLTLNGKGWPATAPVIVDEGDWFVVHYYNEGLQIHPMHLHQMPQLVIAKDGFPLDAPRWEDTVNIAPGERFTVLVQATDPGVWAFHCHILTHAERMEGMFGMVTALIVNEA